MILARMNKRTQILLALLLLTLTANMALFLLPINLLPEPSEAIGVIAGSLFDFVIVMPLLIVMLTGKRFTFKRMMLFMMIGSLTARLIIPAAYFQPFSLVPYAAIGVEGLILLWEICVLFVLLKHAPRVISDVKTSGDGPLLTLTESADKNVRTHPLIRVVCAEIVMFYYAFASWKKRPIRDENRFKLHTKTSLIPLQVMLIHAILFETIAIHWWLYDVSMILSIVLLVLNVYSIFFFIGDIQATRLNPIIVEEKQIRLSLGLGKRITIPFHAIGNMEWGKEAASVNIKDKDVLDFIALNIEDGKPHCVMTFKSPLEATLFMGIKKKYSRVAIRVDEPAKFRSYVERKMNHIQNEM